MDFDIKGKDGKIVKFSIDLPEEEKTPERVYTIPEEYSKEVGVDMTEIKEDKNEITVDKTSEDVDMTTDSDTTNKEYNGSNYDKEEDEDFIPDSIEERIERNSYVDKETRNQLKIEALNFNKFQIRTNFSLVITIVLIVIEIYELFIVNSVNMAYKTVVPAFCFVSFIYFIVSKLRHKKMETNIRNSYNKKYENLCLKWSKFGLKDITSDEDKTENVRKFSNEDGSVIIKSVFPSEEFMSCTEITLTPVCDKDFNNLSLKSEEKEYSLTMKVNSKSKTTLLITGYTYGSGFDSYYSNYNYPKTTERIVKENKLLDDLYDFIYSI